MHAKGGHDTAVASEGTMTESALELESAPPRSQTYNEMYDVDGSVRPHYERYAAWLADKPLEYMLQKQREADTL